MTWLVRALTLGSGRSELVRVLLVAAGGALATVLLLAAALVTAVRGGECADGCVQGGLYRTDLLDQGGLRPGVAVALLLMLIPVLVFLGMCARVSAAQRDRRLAAIRLAGGTPGQVRLLAAAETAVPAGAGAGLGLLVFVVVKVLLERQYQVATDRLLGSALPAGTSYAEALASVPDRALPTDVPLPPLLSLLVLLAVPVLCGASAVLALHRVQTTPLGVARRARPTPRATGLALIAFGVVLPAVAVPLGVHVLPVLAVGAALVMLGLSACGSWLAARTGAVIAARTGRPALLLAARRLQADPRAQGRALTGVVLAVFVASTAGVLRSVTLQLAPDDAFFRGAYNLVDLALLVALVVAAAGLLVAACEAVLAGRRTLASLWAAGVPAATLRTAVLLQALLPAVPALLLAAATGTLAGQVSAVAVGELTVPWLRLLVVLAVALAAVAASTALALPLLGRSRSPSALRQT